MERTRRISHLESTEDAGVSHTQVAGELSEVTSKHVQVPQHLQEPDTHGQHNSTSKPTAPPPTRYTASHHCIQYRITIIPNIFHNYTTSNVLLTSTF